MITDRETGRSRGFGFVEMANDDETAIEELTGAEYDGKVISVTEAKPKTDKPRGGGGFNRERSGGGGFNRGGGRGGFDRDSRSGGGERRSGGFDRASRGGGERRGGSRRD